MLSGGRFSAPTVNGTYQVYYALLNCTTLKEERAMWGCVKTHILQEYQLLSTQLMNNQP